MKVSANTTAAVVNGMLTPSTTQCPAGQPARPNASRRPTPATVGRENHRQGDDRLEHPLAPELGGRQQVGDRQPKRVRARPWRRALVSRLNRIAASTSGSRTRRCRRPGGPAGTGRGAVGPAAAPAPPAQRDGDATCQSARTSLPSCGSIASARLRGAGSAASAAGRNPCRCSTPGPAGASRVATNPGAAGVAGRRGGRRPDRWR